MVVSMRQEAGGRWRGAISAGCGVSLPSVWSGANRCGVHGACRGGYGGIVRTTVDLDEDILRVAKDLARKREQSLGRVLSDLARRGLGRVGTIAAVKGAIPVLPRNIGAKPVTSEMLVSCWRQTRGGRPSRKMAGAGDLQLAATPAQGLAISGLC